MDGFLNVNKPSGWTSHDVVARLRSLLKVKRVGHTGTLDPAAVGVLPICLGKATRLARFLSDSDKEYLAVMRMGETTDTQDATGKILSSRSVKNLTEEKIKAVLSEFIGEVSQMPPMYSAVKVGGQPLYKAARAGREVVRESRTITLHRIDFLAWRERDVTFRVTCSKGTYIRTLCADVGERLGTGAHLVHLERTRSGPFRIEEAATIPDLENAVRKDRILDYLRTPGQVLKDFPHVRVTSEGFRRVMNGNGIGLKGIERLPKEFETGQHILVYNDDGQLLALAEALVGLHEVPQRGDRNMFKVEKLLV